MLDHEDPGAVTERRIDRVEHVRRHYETGDLPLERVDLILVCQAGVEQDDQLRPEGGDHLDRMAELECLLIPGSRVDAGHGAGVLIRHPELSAREREVPSTVSGLIC